MNVPPRKPVSMTNVNPLQAPSVTPASPTRPSETHDKLSTRRAQRRKWKLAPLTRRLVGYLKPIKQIPLTWLGALGTITLFTLTVQYAMTATLGRGASWSHTTQSHSILLLRVLSEATGVALAATIESSFERLQWMLTSRYRGLSLPTFFGLHAGTGVLGLLALTFGKTSGWGTRLWTLTRLFFKVVVPVLAVLIMSEVTTEVVSTAQTMFPVAAGIGPFEPTFANDYAPIAGIYFATDLTSFLSNPERAVPIEPVQQLTTPCTLNESQKRLKACSASYFVPGGLELITPWPSKNEDDWSAELYMVKDLRGYQLDFSQMPADTRFDGTQDCRVFGDSNSGIQICASSANNVLSAKFVHCPIEISTSSACNTNTTWQASTGWSTSLQAYYRHATTSFSRANSSILEISHSSLSPPQAALISAQDLLSVYNASFNATSTDSANDSGNQFIKYLSTVLTFAETSSISYNAAGDYLRNLVALPLYYFNANNLSPDVSPSPDQPLAGLPAELYTNASLATSSYQILVNRATVVTYIALSSLVLLACLIVLIMGSLTMTASRCPETTFWPALDFVANCEVKEEIGEAGGKGLMERLKECRGLGSRREIRKKIDIGVVLDWGWKEGSG